MFRRWFRRETIPSRDAADALYAAQSYAQAAAMYRALALQGDPEGAFGLGRCYELGTGQVKNPTLAVRHYREAAEKGYVPAMARLGELYLSGIGEAGTVTPGGAARLGAATHAGHEVRVVRPRKGIERDHHLTRFECCSRRPRRNIIRLRARDKIATPARCACGGGR